MRRTKLLSLVVGLLGLSAVHSGAQQFPLLDQLAQRVVEKYQNSSCQQLQAERARPKSPSQAEQRAVLMLHQNAQTRQEFIGRVAAPIANKLFECGLIP
jgi:hypothetical protein